MDTSEATQVAVRLAVKLSDNDIVTEEHQNELMRWRDVFRVGQFDIGDIAAEEIIRMAQSGVAVTHDRIFSAIGKFCGKESRTVRYYYETAIFFSQSARREFDELPFSHFVLARQYKDHWRDVLGYSQANVGISNAKLVEWTESRWWQRPIPAQKFSGDEIPDEKEDGFKEADVQKKSCEVPQDYGEARVQYFSSVEVLQAYVDRTKYFMGQLEDIKINEDAKENIRFHSEKLISWIEHALMLG